MMIKFDRLWETMKKKGVSQYALIRKYGISTGQLDRLRKNENVSTHTINMLCTVLSCEIGDISEFVMTDEDLKAMEKLEKDENI